MGSYLVTDDKEDILFYTEYNSKILFETLSTKFDNDLLLVRKYITHSDLLTMGKPSKNNKVTMNNIDFCKSFILYYQSLDELLKMKDLPTAAQSNIVLPNEAYAKVGIMHYAENNKNQYELLDKYGYTALLPSDSIIDFNPKIFSRIGTANKKFKYKKEILRGLSKYDYEKSVSAIDKNYYQFDSLHIAAHGLGTEKDLLLHHIRTMVFKGDVLNIVFDKTEKIMYLFFERNEKYYELANEINAKSITAPIWRAYDKKDRKKIVETLYAKDVIESAMKNESQDEIMFEINESEIAKILANYNREYSKTIQDIIASGSCPKYRWYQKKWKEVLIKSYEIAFNQKGYAVCAISGITGEYSKLGRFFIASHIKPYALCVKEKDYNSAFNPNNGLILSANMDALFDQFLISVDQQSNILIGEKAKTLSGYRKVFNNKTNILDYYMTEERKMFLSLHEAEYNKRSGLL